MSMAEILGLGLMLLGVLNLGVMIVALLKKDGDRRE